MKWTALFLVSTILAGCSASTDATANDREADNSVVENVAIAADWPDTLKPFGDGYPNAGDPCRRVGESAATSNYLDDSADLVGCPTVDAAKALGGTVVGTEGGITLVSVPRGDANAGMGENGPAS